MAKLIFKLDDGQEIVVNITGRTTIGRLEGNDVVVNDRRISGKHAVLQMTPENQFEVEDLGSKGGTFVNEQRVEKVLLFDGDALRFGPLQGRFLLESAEATAKKKAPAAKKTPKAKGVAETSKATRRADAKPPAETFTSLDERTSPLAIEANLDAKLISLKKTLLETETSLQEILTKRNQTEVELHEQTTHLVRLRQEAAATENRLKETQQQVQSTTETLQARQGEIEHLKGEEVRLADIHAAVQTAQQEQSILQAVLPTLEAQKKDQQKEIGELQATAQSLQADIRSGEATRDAAQAKVEQLKQEQALLETRLLETQQQCTAAEERIASLLALMKTRQEESGALETHVQALEGQRSGLETRIKELGGSEEKLIKAQAELQETNLRQTTLQAALAALTVSHVAAQSHDRELQDKLKNLEISLTQAESGLSIARMAQTEAEASLQEFQSSSDETRRHLESEKASLVTSLSITRAEFAEEEQRLEQLTAQREDLIRQCQELEKTSQKLESTRSALVQSEADQTALQLAMATLQGEEKELQDSVEKLREDAESLQGRIEVLKGREHDLRKELDSLSEREQHARERFEEISKLGSDAEKEHADQKERLARSLDLSRRELADLEIKLTPLRQWKEDMDKRYERLATLPEDSAEARTVWREIESEKANLRGLISNREGHTRGITLSESVLRGLGAAHEESVAEAAPPKPKSKLHAPEAVIEPETPEQRGNVGHTGTGAMLSGTGQEMTLKARITRLRESVQREATRLEFLRQERAREETRNKTGKAGSESMLKEHERQLEIKVRREEEHLATVQRKLEMAEVEEEKRREKIAELERKLSELKSDIAEAERDRNDARHQAEIAQGESLEKQKRTLTSEPHTNPEPAGGGVLASIVNSSRSKALNLKPLGGSKD